ncbi:MAG: SH3 domain-containing protein [Candidatus Omnitrophica bacterium]|nr:SH3 domain-containing protein [Candidatus Omnitrophota bacterium]
MGILFFLLPLNTHAADNGALTDFINANSAYREGKYLQAIQGYHNILAAGFESGPVYYNLANAHFKNKELGKAIVNYERANRIMPRDRDLIANYKFALSDVVGRTEYSKNLFERTWTSHNRFYSTNEMILITVLLLIMAAFCHLAGLYWQRQYLRIGTILFALLFVIFVIGLQIKIDLERDAGIVMTAVPARFEPTDKATVYFELPQGQAVKELGKEGDWLKVERPDGKIGWVPAVSIERI